MDTIAEEILTFWFETTNLSAEMERREIWFKSTPEFDNHLVEHFIGNARNSH